MNLIKQKESELQSLQKKYEQAAKQEGVSRVPEFRKRFERKFFGNGYLLIYVHKVKSVENYPNGLCIVTLDIDSIDTRNPFETWSRETRSFDVLNICNQYTYLPIVKQHNDAIDDLIKLRQKALDKFSSKYAELAVNAISELPTP